MLERACVASGSAAAAVAVLEAEADNSLILREAKERQSEEGKNGWAEPDTSDRTNELDCLDSKDAVLEPLVHLCADGQRRDRTIRCSCR